MPPFLSFRHGKSGVFLLVFLTTWFSSWWIISRKSCDILQNLHFVSNKLDSGLPEPVNLHTFDNRTATEQPFFGAYFPEENGRLGYVADPYALKRGVKAFLTSNLSNTSTKNTRNGIHWDLWANYQAQERVGIFNASTMSLASEFVCAFPPGQGLEEDGGFRILTEKIKIAKDREGKQLPQQRPRILCAMYTHKPMHDLARAAALTWGWKCDGFLAFSTQTVPKLGFVHLKHPGPESYGNMWQKVRSIWHYIHKYYKDEFDFIHLCGDDTYVLVSNLRRFLAQHFQQQTLNQTGSLHAGQWVRQRRQAYISGGPGYTISWSTLQSFVSAQSCHADTVAYYEDRLFSQCVQTRGIPPSDTRDPVSGEQMYHDCSPHTLYTSRSTGKSFHARGMAYWESLPMPFSSKIPTESSDQRVAVNDIATGPKIHLEAAAPYTVAFHQLHSPLYMMRVHAILHSSCPDDSPLGRGLHLIRNNGF